MIRVFIDATTASNGFPDFSTEDATGAFGATTHEVDLSNMESAGPDMAVEDAIEQLGTGSQLVGNRFVRLRVVFDVSRIFPFVGLMSDEPDKDMINATFAIPGSPMVPIAPMTADNTDAAPEGVPAVAEVRLNFIP